MNPFRAARIASVRITPIALKDPPLLNASGVHQPYALRSIIEIESDDGALGLGETYGEQGTLSRLQAVAPHLAGASPLDLRALEAVVRTQGFSADEQRAMAESPASPAARAFAKVFGAFETALADLCARREGVPLAVGLAGPVRDRVPYSAYLFYKFAQHIEQPYDADRWGAAPDAEGIVRQARQMVGEFGFRSIKLKAGVFEPELEADALLALRAAFPDHPLRIDPNGNWSVATAQRIAQRLGSELEYYEDPVPTLGDMAALRSLTGLELATNMVVCDVPSCAKTCGWVQCRRSCSTTTPGRLSRHARAGGDVPDLRLAHVNALELRRDQPHGDDPPGGVVTRPRLCRRHALPRAMRRPAQGRADPGRRRRGAAAPVSWARCRHRPRRARRPA